MAVPVRRRRQATRRELGFLVIGVLLGVVAFPLGVIASHQFLDVPDSNVYHNDIDAIADAGVTTGCGGNNYCPSAFVTREQMAAFMNRLGALGPGKTPVVNADKLDGLDSSAFLQSKTVSGHYTCNGIALVPTSGSYTYSWASGRNSISNVDIAYACQLILPDGALITALRGFVNDTSASEEVGGCFIHQFTLATLLQNFIGTTGTSGDAFAGGSAVIEDTSIGITIDNATYAYALYCYIGGTGTDLSIKGIQVDYEITGLPVP